MNQAAGIFTALDLLRTASFLAGIAVMLLAFYGLHDPLASMAVYGSAMMALNQIAPPLLLLGLPPEWRAGLRRTVIGDWLFDPWVAFSAFVLFTIAVSLPGIFNAALAHAVFAAPLGLFELIVGLMFWAQLLPCSQTITPSWRAGLYGWLGGTPMMVIGLVWIWSSHVFYAPYLNVICEWNITPLQDQKWAGVLMVIFGIPLQLRSIWVLSEMFFEIR
ncbi:MULTISPECIES: cytochrome c oxidase assembly protein [Acidiphilium]|uniref:Cytochrome c oxidase caa3 assembly factor (Caa3_CtaG) n=1 Tax=Acidiphilium rubrum TaxID=526 RepID=A0A8G2FF68_ACIRU|nr:MULTISPECIES: cytochrome c oxidase assembly protein [Acidiphilium]MCW8308725.1 cytochrome c oxidase assembly protein [Acidiphilium sp. PA]SIR54295.1 Cytochrome c oxidase caa3 assembly factor (Caa3_CtaG) [Acidiphilium rubrum]